MKKLLFLLVSISFIIMISSCTNKDGTLEKTEKNLPIEKENKQGGAEVITPSELPQQPNL